MFQSSLLCKMSLFSSNSSSSTTSTDTRGICFEPAGGSYSCQLTNGFFIFRGRFISKALKNYEKLKLFNKQTLGSAARL